jgi:hypothetical protein
MKWFDRIAQGFSPGNWQRKTRPERAAEIRDVSYRQRHLLRLRRRSDSVALAGRGRVGAFPRAKALGCSLRPFHGQKLPGSVSFFKPGYA